MEAFERLQTAIIGASNQLLAATPTKPLTDWQYAISLAVDCNYPYGDMSPREYAHLFTKSLIGNITLWA